MIPKVIIVTTIVLSGGCSTFKQPPGTRSMIAFDKPSPGCIETYRDSDISKRWKGYTCAEGQTVSAISLTTLGLPLGTYPYQNAPAPPAANVAWNLTPATPCDESLWAHIYHQKRLQVKAACITVYGTMVDATNGRDKDGCRHEADGDCHTWLKLDPVEEGLLNSANRQNEGGNLVLEPICRYRVTQPDAIQACKNWKQDLKLPSPGTRVRVTGAYVLDTQHGHFEIHPITSIEPFAANANSCSDDGRLWWPARADGQCYAADKPN